MGARDRSAARHGEGAQDHASCELDLIQDEPGEVTQYGPGRFMEWAVGKEGEIMRPNSGKLMLPGSRIVWDIHYSATRDEDITDVVEMGIYFYPKGQEPKYRQHLLRMGRTGDGAIDIPPFRHGQRDVLPAETGGAYRELSAAHAPSRQGDVARSDPPRRADGDSEPRRSVHLQLALAYVYADDAAPLVPKGTVAKITAWHDNTAANKANPDPNVWVGYGDRTVDEMGHAWVNVTYLTDAEYAAEARRAACAAPRERHARQMRTLRRMTWPPAVAAALVGWAMAIPRAAQQPERHWCSNRSATGEASIRRSKDGGRTRTATP